ncbi:hypothetical protein DPMN_076878 [Dreissena polymorpha]|uniref:Uncharacterized protein n=1 Tax=Dreissena polymorpha TaxID=45954 RepID=A0A9D4BQV6_DREPO|nr:hypothetical protein DPMN_076878 [Dreissena polymorpha]
MSQAATTSQAESERFTPSKEPFYKKPCIVGRFQFWREYSEDKTDVPIPTKDYGFDTYGDMFVLDSSGERWTLDPAVLTEISNPKMVSNAPPCETSKTFKKGDLVLICNDSDELKILQGDLWRDRMALASGKIGSIRDIIDNQLIITLPMKVSAMEPRFVCKPEAVTLLNYERMTDLLEKHFEKHEPANMCGELVQAVKKKMPKEVINLLRTAIKKRGTEGDVENDTDLDPYHDIFVIFEKDNESEMKFRVQLETAIESKYEGKIIRFYP